MTISEFLTIGTLTPTIFDPPDIIPGTGLVEVTGLGSRLDVADDIDLAFLGIGTLVVGDGGRVAITNDLNSTSPAFGAVHAVLSQADDSTDPLILVGDLASLLGTTMLDVEFAEGYAPVAGATFTLVQAAFINGDFVETLPPLPPPLTWSYSKTNTTITLTVVPGSPDLDDNGVVDGADLGLLLAAWGLDDDVADLNGDQVVDGADLGVLLASWT